MVGTPATSMLSLTTNGTPNSGSDAGSTPASAATSARARLDARRSDQHAGRRAVEGAQHAVDDRLQRHAAAHRGGELGQPPTRRVDRHRRAHAPSAASTSAEEATAPNTPPCIVTIFSAASWFAGSVAPVQSLRIRHS